MPLIDWRQEFELGIASVDHEHKELIDLINDLHAGLEGDATPEMLSAFLGEIYARIAAHFALEEKVMRDVRYRGYDEHKADHEELLEAIREIMDDYEAGAFAELSDVLAERLRAWFADHFRDQDARLHHALERHGSSGA